MGLLVWDLSPLWVMLVVDKENGVYGTECMEFLPRVKQCVMFYLCRTFGEFFVEFIKYNFIVHVYGCLNKLVHERLHSSYHLVINECVCSCSLMTWYGHGWTLDANTRTSNTCVDSHQLPPCPCVVYQYYSCASYIYIYIYISLTIDMCTILRLIHHVIFFGLCHPVPRLAVFLHL